MFIIIVNDFQNEIVLSFLLIVIFYNSLIRLCGLHSPIEEPAVCDRRAELLLAERTELLLRRERRGHSCFGVRVVRRRLRVLKTLILQGGLHVVTRLSSSV